METVFVRPQPATLLAIANPHWDGEGLTVSCEVTYFPGPMSEPKMPLRDAIDKQFGFVPPSYVITAGKLSLLLDAERRLAALDFFTNPGQWVERALEPIAETPGEPYVDAPFDELGRAGEADGPRVCYDPGIKTLCLQWGNAGVWCRVASTLALGLDPDGRLMQIRLGGLYVPGQQYNEARRPHDWSAAVRRLVRRRAEPARGRPG